MPLLRELGCAAAAAHAQRRGGGAAAERWALRAVGPAPPIGVVPPHPPFAITGCRRAVERPKSKPRGAPRSNSFLQRVGPPKILTSPIDRKLQASRNSLCGSPRFRAAPLPPGRRS